MTAVESMRTYGFGIVGCGVIAPTHVRAIEALPRARLVGVADIDQAKAERLADQEQVTAFADLGAMLADPTVDVVTVCVPSGLHAQVGIEAANAGKHLIVEKPIDVSLDAADRLLAAVGDAGVTMTVISQHRFSPGHQYLRGLVGSGALGRPVLGEAIVKWYRSQGYYDSAAWRGTWALDGGGAVMNQGVHYVDLLRWIMGPVTSITAVCSTRAHTGIEVEDVALATVRFESGAVGLIEASTAVFPGFAARLEVTGTLGTVIVEDGVVISEELMGAREVGDYGARAPAPASEAAPAAPPADPAAAADPAALSQSGHVAQFADFIDAIDRGRPPAVTGMEARTTLALVLALYAAAGVGPTAGRGAAGVGPPPVGAPPA
jgi:UDP-N-acetyl-2-amino-2-deoxyglucuronate dehydrogenase